LPTKITFGTTGTIVYVYNAMGQKVQKMVNSLLPTPTVTTTNYLGGFQYKGVGTVIPALQFFPTAEGYVTKTSTTYDYVFNYTDHLGNVRLSYQDKNKDTTITSDEIIEENNYYPFGMKHEGYNTTGTPPDYKYKYNGKELQEELGLNVYDYGAMMYDPVTGRRNNIDPKAELMRRWSTYAYCFNNPMRFTDPDGMSPTDWIRNNATGQYTWDNNVTSAANTPAGYEYKGKEYNGISIRTYEATSTATSAGLDIQVNYNGSEASADIDFMQTVTTNMPAKGATSPYNDPQPSDDSKPFYYTDSEKPSYSDKLGKDLIFIDSPVRPNSKEGTTWSGELSVTKKSDVVHSIAETLNYGFEIKRGNAVLTPIIVQPASDFQKTTLGNYNKTLKKD
jgi:RHS repeat-associated protein